jgi:hypothetical protein
MCKLGSDKNIYRPAELKLCIINSQAISHGADKTASDKPDEIQIAAQ